MDGATTLWLRNDLSELARIAAEVERFARARSVPEQALFELNLALDEVLTNVISYGYEDDGPHRIAVRLQLDGGDLVVEVEDDGCAFDPLGVPPPDLEKPLQEKPIGGLGVHLVRRAVDALAYRREPGKNVLTMRKRVLRAGPGSEKE
jgi:anti-sigma regulatory factor (Ser/Thr protein kinase)